MRLTAALSGDLGKLLAEEVRAAETAVTAGVQTAGQALKAELRQQVTSAGLGSRLANTWRDRHYANRKVDAASLVWTKAPQIIRAFAEGVTIRSQRGRWLAIPTENAPRKGTGGRRVSLAGARPRRQARRLRSGRWRLLQRPSRPGALAHRRHGLGQRIDVTDGVVHLWGLVDGASASPMRSETRTASSLCSRSMRRAPEITRTRLYLEAIEEILPKVQIYVIDTEKGRVPLNLRVGKP